MFRSHNVVTRIFDRQISSPPPGAAVHYARRFYENLVPNFTIYEVDCPDHLFRKFTDDGQYLICFSRNHQKLIVYRPSWLSYSCKGDCASSCDLPPKAGRFESFFTQLYSVSLPSSSNELICKDFFLYMESNRYGLFATSTAQSPEPTPVGGGALLSVPSIETITFHLLKLEDGVVLDQRSFHHDFINLAHNSGAFLYDDLLAIVSLRYQTLHILQIRDSGNLVYVRAIGTYCREDDELFLNSHLQNINETTVSCFHSGLKQRLLSFIFRGMWSEETDPTLRVQGLKKKFYFHFQDYVDLIIWKVQFLDRHHLLIKFGSVEGVVSRNTDLHPAFFAVYNMETTEIIAFYQNSADELYLLFEQFYDHFQATSRNSYTMNFVSSHSNNMHAREQLRCVKNKASSSLQLMNLQFVKKMLASLPSNCQSQSPSPYFDQSLFRFDEKLISATDRHRQSTDHPIKFILRRQPYTLKFKIKPDIEVIVLQTQKSGVSHIKVLCSQRSRSLILKVQKESWTCIIFFSQACVGPEAGCIDSRTKKISSFLFHPFLPLALSIQQTLYLQPAVVNIHFRR